MEGILLVSKLILRFGLFFCFYGLLVFMFMLYYFVFKGIFRCCFDNLFVIFYCIVEMNILLIEDGKYVVLGCYLFYKKEMYVC